MNSEQHRFRSDISIKYWASVRMFVCYRNPDTLRYNECFEVVLLWVFIHSPVNKFSSTFTLSVMRLFFKLTRVHLLLTVSSELRNSEVFVNTHVRGLHVKESCVRDVFLGKKS